MNARDRRLIGDDIPMREISTEASREKSIRKGHISTLHLWWARRADERPAQKKPSCSTQTCDKRP